MTSLAAVASKAISTISWAVTVPLTLRYLGTERFALWMTTSSLVLMLSFADLGLGNGLMNAIARCFGEDDERGARQYIASATAFLVGVAAVGGALLWCSWQSLPWPRLLSVQSPNAIAEVGPAAAVLIGCFLAGLPLSVVQKVQAGYQQGVAANLWNALGSVFGLAGLIVAIHAHAGLPWLVLASSGGPVLALALNTLHYFGWQRRALRPSISQVDRARAEELLRVGGLFFVLQLAATLAFQSDTLVLAHVLGPGAVAQYVVVGKLFAIVPMMLSFVLVPLWPAYGEAVARGDVAWARRTLMSSMRIGVAFSLPVNLLLVVATPMLLRWWVGSQIIPAWSLLVGLAMFGTMQAFGGSWSVFLNGIGEMRYQVVMASLMAVMNLGISIYLTRRIGISGVVFGSVIAQAVFVFIPAFFYVPRLLNRLESARRAVERNI